MMHQELLLNQKMVEKDIVYKDKTVDIEIKGKTIMQEYIFH